MKSTPVRPGLAGFASVCLLLATLMLPAQAQVAVQAQPKVTVQASPQAVAQQFTLANGLTLIVKPDRRAPTVMHMLWLRLGSMDEVDGSSGVAHVLEHMMFKGTTTLKAGEFSRRVAALGRPENAFTSKDDTGYYQQIPASRLAQAKLLLPARFSHSLCDV